MRRGDDRFRALGFVVTGIAGVVVCGWWAGPVAPPAERLPPVSSAPISWTPERAAPAAIAASSRRAAPIRAEALAIPMDGSLEQLLSNSTKTEEDPISIPIPIPSLAGESAGPAALPPLAEPPLVLLLAVAVSGPGLARRGRRADQCEGASARPPVREREPRA
jgi:hypothetical protein